MQTGGIGQPLIQQHQIGRVTVAPSSGLAGGTYAARFESDALQNIAYGVLQADIVVDDEHNPVRRRRAWSRDGFGCHAAGSDAEATSDSSLPTENGFCKMAKAFASTAARNRSSIA